MQLYYSRHNVQMYIICTRLKLKRGLDYIILYIYILLRRCLNTNPQLHFVNRFFDWRIPRKDYPPRRIIFLKCLYFFDMVQSLNSVMDFNIKGVVRFVWSFGSSAYNILIYLVSLIIDKYFLRIWDSLPRLKLVIFCR